jgi:hypothetical protein
MPIEINSKHQLQVQDPKKSFQAKDPKEVKRKVYENIQKMSLKMMTMPQLPNLGGDVDLNEGMNQFQKTVTAYQEAEVEIQKLDSEILQDKELFKAEDVLGKEVNYNDSGRKGTRLENSLSFNYNIDKNLFPQGKFLSANLRIVNSRGLVHQQDDVKDAKLGKNHFEWTSDKELDSREEYKLEVDLKFDDKERKIQTIQNVADYRGRVDSIRVKGRLGRPGQKKLIIDGSEIDSERIVEVLADKQKDKPLVDYLNLLGQTVELTNKQKIIVAGVDISDPEDIKLSTILDNEAGGKDMLFYSLKKVASFLSTDVLEQHSSDLDGEEAAEPPIDPASAQQKKELSSIEKGDLLLSGSNFLNKTVRGGVIYEGEQTFESADFGVQNTKEIKISLGTKEECKRYANKILGWQIKNIKGYTDLANPNKNINRVELNDQTGELSLVIPKGKLSKKSIIMNGVDTKQKVLIFDFPEAKVQGYRIKDSELVLQTDKGEAELDMIKMVVT